MDTPVDPIDDQLDFSCKINLRPPNVDTCALNNNALSCDDCVNPLVCAFNQLSEDVCDVIKEPQISDDVDKVGHLDMSDSLSISIVENPITNLAHRDHVLKDTSKNDIFLF